MTKQPQTDDDPRQNYDFVFIVAYARSGSTLLQALLNSCKDVCIRGENNNALYHLSRTIQALEDTRSDHGNPVTASRQDEPWYGANRVEAALFEKRALTIFLRRVLTPPDTARVIGFKEIRHIRAFIPDGEFAAYMDFLLTRFPRAKIVFNSRQASDVANSAFLLKERPDSVAAWVTNADARFAQVAARSDRVIHMRYEDWVADHGKIHAMLDFLGLEWTPEAVERVMATRLTHGKD